MIKGILKSLKKNCLRILLWVLSTFCVFGLTVFLFGYFAASRPESYLPEIHPDDLRQHQTALNQIRLKNSGYILLVGENGDINVKTNEGKPVMSDLIYYSSYEGTTERWGLDKVSVKLTSDSTIIVAGEGSLGVLVSILITVPKDKPKLDIDINTRYKLSTIVDREAVVAGFDVPVSQVYRKNRMIDSAHFEPVYWLDRQGVRFGSGPESALIYNTPFVSSLQLDTKRNLLFVNLEYYLDHPFVNIPYQEDGLGRWVDLSKSKYTAGEERSNKFSLYFGSDHKAIPRIMLVPNGYLAGYIFTEHADGGNIKTQRAAYFGSEDITSIEKAEGGFAGHKIPVTKSVFYVDPDNAKYSSIHDDPDFPQFLNFLNQLYKSGNCDICLHTPENLNSNRHVLEESIKFMKGQFDSRTWIDHGMYNGKINRECFSADGLNPDSQYFAADLWNQYDTRYFWSPAVEMIRNYSLIEEAKKLRLLEVSEHLWSRYLSPEELHNVSFTRALKDMYKRYNDKGELNSLKSYKSNAFPTPLFWLNPTRSGNFYSWVTDYENETDNLSQKKVTVEHKLLDKLISDWGVFIDHGYFVRNSQKDGNLIEKNGKLLINPYFDNILGLMAHMRDSGDLCITTIRDLLDYWVLTKKISFEYMPYGVIHINNDNNEAIKGLSLVVRAKTVRINGEIPKFRRVGDDTVFWFDISAKQSMSIQIEQ
jgi:hypothetical protein